MALTFRPFLATFSIFEKEAKNNKKVRLYIAVTFRPFLATFPICHNWAKKNISSIFSDFFHFS
jgi:hypothetical protein